MKKVYMYLAGLLSGFANGLFGSGGGVIIVPMLKKAGVEQKKAHSTSLAVILPLSIISALFYLKENSFDFLYALKYLPAGVVGTIIGCLILKKISNKFLKKLFGSLLVIAGLRMLLL